MTSRPRPALDRRPLDPAVLHASLLPPAGPLHHLEVRGEDPSTNTSLVAAAMAQPGTWRAPSVLVADHQVAGRGRLGRVWRTPAGAALTMSVLLAPRARPLTWVPLLTGLVVSSVVRETTGLDAGVKWPNDVLVAVPGAPSLPVVGTRRKVAGILAEVTPAGDVVVGVGLNVLQGPTELPVETAASLASALAAGREAGADVAAQAPTREELASAIVSRLVVTIARWDAAADLDGAEPIVSSGLLAEVEPCLVTIGSHVRAELTDGAAVMGRAVGLAPDGALLVETEDGTRTEVRSGDVHHLRTSTGREPAP